MGGFSIPIDGTDNNALRELRDSINELSEETKKSNKITARLNTGIFWLTIIYTAVTLIQFYTSFRK